MTYKQMESSSCLLIPNWELVQQEKGLTTEGSASHSAWRE